MRTVFITGANRGLGLEFVKQYVAQGDTVHACCRRPGGAAELKALEKANRATLHVHALDVTRTEAVQRLAGALSETAIDILINNAGVFGPKAESEKDPRQSLGHIDEEIVAKVIRINAVAPLVVAQAFTEHVARSAGRKMVAISSSLGSIADTSGGYYAYRMSKAALNMAMATVAKDLAPRGIAVQVFCPGWVRTEMGGASAPQTVEESVRGMKGLIDAALTPGAANFQLFDGTPRRW
ncbi:MAG: SDR family oxidoreductase [Vicinamibacteria bacterium]|nr:SDR family oxidoreductase [Vicinamibacteria bacterium]